jgi:nitrite reductase/ring-hydroxylating ferredoxin subunit
MTRSVRLCRVDELEERCARGFDPASSGRDALFLVRLDGRLHGWLDRCPHEGDTPLPYRRHAYLNRDGTRIVCFAHGGQFDIATGQGLAGPCLGMALTPVALRVTADGEVLADLDLAGRA